jgi:hypothetical protein
MACIQNKRRNHVKNDVKVKGQANDDPLSLYLYVDQSLSVPTLRLKTQRPKVRVPTLIGVLPSLAGGEGRVGIICTV